MRDVVVTGVGMTPFGKFPSQDLKQLTSVAVRDALKDAGIDTNDVEYVAFANAVGGAITGQEMVAGQVCLAPIGLRNIPILNVENACASASTALAVAYMAVASGLVDVALAVGAEKMTHPDKRVSHEAISRAGDVEVVAAKRARNEIEVSYFMDLYARAARRYLATTDATPEDFAAVAVKNQRHGSLNPRAQYGGSYSVEDILHSPVVVTPLHLLMCSPISDGAAAAVVVAEERLAMNPDHRRKVRILASQVTSGGWPSAGETRAVPLAAHRAFEQAGLGPGDIHCLELHDATAPAEIELYESMDFAEPGEGVRLIREGATALSGKIPVNTSGGLLAKGHPIGATGLAQVCEVIWQLRGEAGERQVDGAQIALTQNGGGWVSEDNAAASVHIFATI
ncbi:MAG TPA: thiolase family protein [Acidimicrobiia bacterium]|nr:thiolase family protein [Acidimicrobiia bacterium]